MEAFSAVTFLKCKKHRFFFAIQAEELLLFSVTSKYRSLKACPLTPLHEGFFRVFCPVLSYAKSSSPSEVHKLCVV